MTSATRRRCWSVSRGESNGVVMLAPTQRTQPGHLVLALDPAPLSEAALERGRHAPTTARRVWQVQ